MKLFSLRSNLVLLVFGTALPLLVLAVWLSVTLIAHNRETLANNALYRVRAFMSAVDAELKGTITSLQALAVSERLDENDLAGFHREASRFIQFQPRIGTIRLALPNGQVVVNTRQPYGFAQFSAIDPESFDKVLATKAPVIGDLTFGPDSKTYLVIVRIPVIRKGKLAYVLSTGINPRVFADLIEQQQLPDDWVSGLVDAKGRIIARRPAVAPNTLASPGFLAELARAKEGWYRGNTVEGRDTYTAYTTSSFSGWGLGLAIPRDRVYAPVSRAAWLLGIGFLISLALAFMFAYAMSRRISAPVAELANSARSFATGPVPPRLPQSNIREVADLTGALTDAVGAVRERQMLLEREKAALQAADKAKDEFLAMLSHELRNPLGVLTTSVHLLRVGKADQALSEKTQTIIERQLKQITRLVEDLLDVSRITMGKASLKREVFDLSELVARTVAARAPAQNGAFNVTVEAAPVCIDADRTRIEQVLANLLDNAQKFSPAGEPILVSVAQENASAVLTVADRGEGIPADMLERVFGLFVQGEQGPDRARGGMGVGLALVRRLVEMHGGTVSAFSDGPGKGAKFVVRLPAVTRVPRPPTEPAAADPNARRILIIEDNADAREMLQALLLIDGHRVALAPDGSAGIEMFVRDEFDVVFLDIGLPDIDGYDVARELRRRSHRHVVLVALTGYGQAQDERRALEAGFNIHLVKPVTVEQLRQVIAAL